MIKKIETINVYCVLGKAQVDLVEKILEEKEEQAVSFVVSVYKTPKLNNVSVLSISRNDFLLNYLSIFYLIVGFGFAKKINLYTPHFLNFLPNILYSKYKKKISVYYLYDGLLNYRKVNWDNPDIIKIRRSNFIKSLLLLKKYRRHGNSICDDELDEVEEMYVPCDCNIEYIRFKKNIVRIPIGYSKKMELLVNQRGVLFLEPFNLSNNDRRRVLSAFIKFVEEHEINKITIKTHPSQKGSRFKDEISSRVIDANCVVETPASEECSAEEIYNKEPMRYVFTDFSSAALNIKASNKNVVIVTCINFINKDVDREVYNYIRSIGAVFL